jgi:hypothetical protein
MLSSAAFRSADHTGAVVTEEVEEAELKLRDQAIYESEMISALVDLEIILR